MLDFVVVSWNNLAISGKALGVSVLIPWACVLEINEKLVWQAPNGGKVHTWHLVFDTNEQSFRQFAQRRHDEANT